MTYTLHVFHEIYCYLKSSKMTIQYENDDRGIFTMEHFNQIMILTAEIQIGNLVWWACDYWCISIWYALNIYIFLIYQTNTIKRFSINEDNGFLFFHLISFNSMQFISIFRASLDKYNNTFVVCVLYQYHHEFKYSHIYCWL